MRCKKHLSDHTSTVGVCASCLRERLETLLAAQAQAQQFHNPRASDDRRKHHAPPQHHQQPVFPRSVSPYVARRKTDDCALPPHRVDQRFYSTPQLGRACESHAPQIETKKKKGGRFSMLTNLFRSKSDKPIRSSELGFESSRVSYATTSSTTSSPFRTAILGQRKNQFSGRKQRWNRGMSPDSDGDSEDGDRSPSGSGYSSESPQRWRRTAAPATTTAPAARRCKQGRGLDVTSTISFCLSPLVRPSPNRNRGYSTELGISGEFRKTPPHLSTAASFCKNRSRKLVDFGRGFPGHR